MNIRTKLLFNEHLLTKLFRMLHPNIDKKIATSEPLTIETDTQKLKGFEIGYINITSLPKNNESK